MVTNIHERFLPAPPDEIGHLLDRLGTPGDPLWPAENIEPMRFDGPLAVGARGGHGPVRYAVTAYEPSRRVEFTFTPKTGINGTHSLEVQPAIGPAGEPGCSMRHTIEGRTHGPMRFLWPLLVRWLHDQVLEELLDRAESHARGQTITTAKPAMWIRLLRRITPSDRADADRAARDRGELLSRPSAA